MPKRTINTRRNRTEAPVTEATEAPVTLGEMLASTEAPEAPVTEAPVTEATTEATTEAPVTDDTTTEAPVTEAPVTLPLQLNLDKTPEALEAPVTATPAKPDAKAEFLERKASATTSAVQLYPGASLAVHRSDKQPSDSTYLARVASPVQKIGPNGPTVRDNSFILAIYDHLSVYHGGDYSAAFNPAHFGADLGTTSRAASVGYLELSTDGQYIHLTAAGRERGTVLANKRNKA